MTKDQRKFLVVPDNYFDGLRQILRSCNPSGAANDISAALEGDKPLVTFETFVTGEWTGLYIDGKLDTYGDSYHTSDRLEVILGVNETHTRDWLVNDRDPLETTAKIAKVTAERQARESRVISLREQAQALLDEAKELEGGT